MTRRRCIMVLLVGISALLLSGPARAHTEVSRATPGPGETVDVGVRSVELVFLDPVLPEVSIEVTDADGRTVPGLTPVEVGPDRTAATVEFDPLAVGRYVVRYSFVAEDGDREDEGYRFTVEDRAADGGLEPALVAVALAVVLIVLAAVLRRRRASPHGP